MSIISPQLQSKRMCLDVLLAAIARCIVLVRFDPQRGVDILGKLAT